ncbi:MAG: Undecaprenyl-phosphate galactosephosphotransferase [Candidatus Angelobacter sp.]|jgi:lipopolysaccharide/colanic/teichoic acid biosynthesis glycosyltransferase|nr:Undecaprenyl-phosphate galactosephosphotransferase [Candidatus Angelobacter sp.]
MSTDLPRLQRDSEPVCCGERFEESLASENAQTTARFLKRLLDIVGAIVLLLLFSPVIALLAVSVKLQDGGHVFHRRRVIGPKGEFDAFKLRSMRMDADELLRRDPQLRRNFALNFKLKSDPRITPIGSVIRKLSLDELPQLFNVLKGEMSLVGPRMITPPELEKYGDAAWIFRLIKPGLTGYWQTEGRQDVSYARRVEMDLFYVKNWSLLFDLKILINTPIKVLRGAGAF